MNKPTVDGDILRQLSEAEVDELLKIYANKFGVENFHYLLLYNQRKWDRHVDNTAHISLRKTFYTHKKGDFRRYGTYVSLHYDLKQSVSFFSWQPDEPSELYECLEQSNLIDWKSGPLLTNVDLQFCARVKQIALQRGASAVQSARSCYGMVLPHAKALEVSVPDVPSDFELRKLTYEDAPLVHSIWPNAGEGSIDFIRELIKYNKTIGACRSDTGELVGWIFQNDFSGLGILQVVPKVERRGLGGLLAAKMSKLIAKGEQVTLTAWIFSDNWRSEALLKRIGYAKSVVNEWIQLAPAH